ncbi:hypothetical protein FM106_11590 [Brachybacterium faecium]|nr:hypothetical protein FM106_11590 [Brachybacterium faecium]
MFLSSIKFIIITPSMFTNNYKTLFVCFFRNRQLLLLFDNF